MSPDAPAVDVMAGNQTLAENVSFGDATQYAYVPAGEYNITVTAADGAAEDDAAETPAEGTPTEGTPAEETPADGTPAEETPADGTPAEGTPAEETPDEGTPMEGTPTDGTPDEGTPTEMTPAEDDATDGEVLYETNVTLDARDVTSIVAQGETTEGGAAPFELVPVSDDAWTPEEDNAALRVAHFSPGAQAVDVTADNGSMVLADNVTVGNTSGYTSVPAGEYTAEIREESPDNNGSVITTVDVSLESEEVYTAWVADSGTAVGQQDGVTETPDEETPTDGEADDAGIQVFLTQDASATIELPAEDAETPAPEETPTPTPDGTETPGMNETETPGEGTPGDGTPTPGEGTPGMGTETPAEGEA